MDFIGLSVSHELSENQIGLKVYVRLDLKKGQTDAAYIHSSQVRSTIFAIFLGHEYHRMHSTLMLFQVHVHQTQIHFWSCIDKKQQKNNNNNNIKYDGIKNRVEM